MTATSLNESRKYERHRAVRALLCSPLIPAIGETSEVFGLIRRHGDWLKEWFLKFPQWVLQLESDFARLKKTPADFLDGTRGLADSQSGIPFNKRRYVLLSLALACLERSERQTTLHRLAEDIGLRASHPDLREAGFQFSLGTQEERRDLVSVVRFLISRRVIHKVAGDEQQYVLGNERGDALFNVHRPILSTILIVKRSPSTISAEDLEARLNLLSEDFPTESDEVRNRRMRARIVRKLLDDPVLYYDELSEMERAYLNGQRSLLIGQIHDATGLISEIRKEGIAMVDEDGTLTDVELPKEGTIGHLTLLLAEFLANWAKNNGPAEIGFASMKSHVAGQIAVYGKHWKKEVTLAGAETGVTLDVLARLEALRLVRVTKHGACPLPAIGRYALGEITESSSSLELALEAP